MMSLPSIHIPANAPPSPSSTADSSAPQTPNDPTNSNPIDSVKSESSSTPSAGSGNKNARKPSRRANTAERRANHNAVERARRETLNGRFLDLAGLLPNLSQIRRPSKSAIVNSSIAHVHASKRHRAMASRELRLLKMEADALRRELNEWRDRAGIPRVEEPQRGDGFGIVLSGELEVIVAPSNGLDEDDEDGDFGGYPGEDPVDYPPEPAYPPPHMRANVNIPGMHPPQMLPNPMIASPTNMAFENPAMGYSGPNPYYAQHPQAALLEEREREREKWYYAQQHQQMMGGRIPASARRPRSSSSLSSGSAGGSPLTSGGYIPESVRYGGGSPGSYEPPSAWMGAGGGGNSGMNNAVYSMMM